MVSNAALAGVAQRVSGAPLRRLLHDSLLTAPNLSMGAKGRADTLEAVVGAIYVDSGQCLATVTFSWSFQSGAKLGWLECVHVVPPRACASSDNAWC